MATKADTMKIVRIALICVFATVFVVSAIMLVNTLIDYRAAEKLYGAVHEDFMNAINNTTGNADENTAKDVWTRGPEGADSTETQPSVPSDTTVSTPDGSSTTAPGGNDTVAPTPGGNETTAPPEPVDPVYSERFLNACKFINELKATNPDVIGYIYVEIDKTDESKNISYPLVHGDDNAYYVDYAYDNSVLRAGSIFLDYRCRANLDKNRVSLIYGHNMTNGAMFHNLKYLKQREYFDNTTITIYTLDAIYTYQPFAIYNTVATANYSHIYFNSNDEYVSFLVEAQNKSIYSNDLEFYSSDRIITLSTCLNTSADARLAVHAVLVRKSQ
ncbi:MAG: class B sortase [Clostridia bacterium]|nr:class B sortase [Clostridia bacterium]